MNNIVFIKRTSAIFLATLLVLGTIAAFSPSFMTTASAQVESYYGMDNNNYKSQYVKDNYKSKDSNSVFVKKINCNNVNVNVNGLELNGLPPFLSNLLFDEDSDGDANSYVSGERSYGSGQSGYDKDFKFVCINNNNNTVIEAEEPVPPTTASLSVKKQVFGCITPNQITMDCTNLQNNSPEWLDCNTNPAISGSVFCQGLPESIFDIEVLDEQNNQIQQFVGSEQGTTIPNLEPGKYTVNEIEDPLSFANQLAEDPIVEEDCISVGFPDGGRVLNLTTSLVYDICFEYEDEQGNDCSTITLAGGESRTCTVKNYIIFASPVF